MATPEVGVHANVPWDVYESWDAMRNSTLKYFSRSPSHGHARGLNPDDDTAAKLYGRAYHAAILEPDTFPQLYAVPPKVDKRTKPGKATWAQWQADHPNTELIAQDQSDQFAGMRRRLFERAGPAQFVREATATELSVVWIDSETGVLCKCRIDLLGHVAGTPALGDFKTCQDASPDAFGRDVARYDYHHQAAFYADGLDAVAPHPRLFVFLAQEKSPPYEPALYVLGNEAMDQGRREYRANLWRYKECREKDEWPGYGSELHYLDLPRWRKDSNEQ